MTDVTSKQKASTNKSYVVFGPQGSGKSEAFARSFAARQGLDRIVDEWDGRLPIQPFGTLYITNLPRDQLPFDDSARRVISIAQAKAILASSL